MITAEDCKKQIDKYSLEFPDPIMMEYYIEKANSYTLSYSAAESKALRVLVVCFMILSSGVREISARGARAGEQTFKNKDSLKALKKAISSLDKDGVIDDLPMERRGLLVGVGGY